MCRTGMPFVAIVSWALAGSLVLTADEAAPPAKWEAAIAAYEAADKTSPPPPGAVLFIGSSSIRRWETLATDFPQYAVINRGFGGSQIADSTHFAERIVIPYQPRVIVLHAGSNDLNGGKSPEQVLADFQAFVEKVHRALPETPIAFLSLNPTPARWPQADKQQQTNRLIREFIAGRKGLAFIDQWDVLLDASGQPREELHVADRLHPNAAGYQIRTELVGKYLATLSLPKKSAGNTDGSR